MSENLKDYDIAIVGGGIAGLCAAITISQKHPEHQIAIFEKRSEKQEIGAGLQLSPNITHILDQIGLLAPIAEKASRPESILMKAGKSGSLLAEVPLGDVAKTRYSTDYLVIHRGDLYEILLDKVQSFSNVTLKLGHELVDTSEDKKTFNFQYNDEIIGIKALAFILADGVWSEAARSLNLDVFNPVNFTKQVAHRALIDANLMGEIYKKHTHVWLGKDAHIVSYPIKSATKINLVMLKQGDKLKQAWSTPSDRDSLREHFKDWHYEILQMIDKADNIIEWPLFASEPGYKQAHNNCLLIGDAAHPTLPYQAQGAGMAIEDAFLLADVLDKYTLEHENILEHKLREFEKDRNDRVTKTQSAANENAKIFHMAGPMALARNVYLKIVSTFKPDLLLKRLDWLYGKKY